MIEYTGSVFVIEPDMDEGIPSTVFIYIAKHNWVWMRWMSTRWTWDISTVVSSVDCRVNLSSNMLMTRFRAHPDDNE